MEMDILNNPLDHRFEVEINGSLAFIDYVLDEGLITLVHTEVPPALGGQGIGGKLVKEALEFAEHHQLLVVPQCPFVQSYINKHEQYRDLVSPN